MHLSRIFLWICNWWKDCPFSAYDFAQFYEEIRVNHHNPYVRSVEWIAPEFGILKFNVDGSSRGNPGISGAGGVVRNHNGEFVGVFSEALGNRWTYEAEVIAILKALQFSKQHSLNHLVIDRIRFLCCGRVGQQ